MVMPGEPALRPGVANFRYTSRRPELEQGLQAGGYTSRTIAALTAVSACRMVAGAVAPYGTKEFVNIKTVVVA
jgi:hypothetical protein